MHAHTTLFPVFGFISLSGCILYMPSRGACDDMAAASVGVSVSTADGGSLEGLQLTYSARGGPSQPCDDITGEWICGYEQAGSIEVTARLPGYRDQTESVVVDSDECHVIQEHLDMVLQPEETACTEIAVAAVEVHLAGSSGELLDSPAVTWNLAGAPASACDTFDEGQTWECGWEVSGDVHVEASAGGHLTQGETVTVPLTPDGCHPVTQRVDIALEWSPD